MGYSIHIKEAERNRIRLINRESEELTFLAFNALSMPKRASSALLSIRSVIFSGVTFLGSGKKKKVKQV